ncbi:MAG: hypothetical protein IGS03_16655 [Candidatus Sericytochromatia bacterium]|nr:hypothetical protein [Candidatus Sericytochromatia bacterium]
MEPTKIYIHRFEQVDQTIELRPDGDALVVAVTGDCGAMVTQSEARLGRRGVQELYVALENYLIFDLNAPPDRDPAFGHNQAKARLRQHHKQLIKRAQESVAKGGSHA